MTRRLLPLAAAFVLFAASGGTDAEAPGTKDTRPARTDDNGDPLPDGAVCRLGSLRFRQESGVGALSRAPDGKTLASSGFQEVKLWGAATGQEIRRLAEAHGPLAWSPDGNALATGIWQYSVICLWDVATGKEIRRIPKNRFLRSLAWSPDGKTLASAGINLNFHLWEAAIRKMIRRCTGHEGEVGALAWSPNGKMLASASSDTTLILWSDDEWSNSWPNSTAGRASGCGNSGRSPPWNGWPRRRRGRCWRSCRRVRRRPV